MQQKNLIILLVAVIIIVLATLGVYFVFPDAFKALTRQVAEIKRDQPRVIEENLVIPETERISGGEGRLAADGESVDVPLVPKNEGEKVIVSKAVLTTKGSYNLATQEVLKWSAGSKLALIKSLGAINLDGKSSQWQLIFVSDDKKGKGYEVIVQADQIVSKKEIDSTAVGAELPKNWFDSDGAIKSLQDLPQFSDATVSSVSFYYNTDGKLWEYALSTSRGVTAISVQ